MSQKSVKGFTLVELLVVIAILAVLATAVVLILNPAELIRQGRDSNRLSELDSLNTALSLYLADVDPSNSDLGSCSPTAGRCTFATTTSPFLAPSTRTGCAEVASTAVDGTGWVDVNFGLISAGSPLPRLPIDPVNSANYHYAYACDDDSDTYEIDAYMESKKFSGGGASGVEGDDGGDNANAYEVGNDPGLNL